MKKEDVEPYIEYKILDNMVDRNELMITRISKNKPLTKWSNSILSDSEIDFLMEISSKYNSIRNIGNISPGIVTDANNYFIINKETSNNIFDESMTLPIISKSRDVEKGIIFSQDDFDKIAEKGKNVYLINIGDTKKCVMSTELKNYLINGEKQQINKRFKCSKRKPWYKVPIVEKGDVFFFKRYHLVPRIMANIGEVYTTDMCYNIRLKDNYDKNSVVFCFYNSLTLALCEYNGRFYGGGVCELTPNEFKNLVIPYKKINYEYVLELDKMIKNNEDINNIVEFVDKIVFDDMYDSDSFKLLKNIREKYIIRRIKR